MKFLKTLLSKCIDKYSVEDIAIIDPPRIDGDLVADDEYIIKILSYADSAFIRYSYIDDKILLNKGFVKIENDTFQIDINGCLDKSKQLFLIGKKGFLELFIRDKQGNLLVGFNDDFKNITINLEFALDMARLGN